MKTNLQRLCAFGDRFQNSLTLVDMGKDDQPLIYVNKAFVNLTGYPFEEIVGRNCRFLQGPKTDPVDRRFIHDSIALRHATYCDLLNYRKDGAVFYNRLCLLPLKIDGGSYFIGMQLDCSALVIQGRAPANSFGNFHMREAIRDRINNSLMKVQAVLAIDHFEPTFEIILERTLSSIRETVLALPAIESPAVGPSDSREAPARPN